MASGGIVELNDDDLRDDVDESDIIREDVETLEAADRLEWTSVDCDLGELGLAQLEAAALEASAREAARLEAAQALPLLAPADLPLPPSRRTPVPPAPTAARASEPPPAPAPMPTFRQEWKGTPRLQLGKETLQVLAPMMVRQLARPAAPPPRFPRSAGMLMAAAAVAAVLLSASAALAWT